MKKSTAGKVALISLILFPISIIIGKTLVPNSPWMIFFSLLAFVSSFVALIFLIIFVVKAIKEHSSKKRKSFDIWLSIWKWLNILKVIFFVIMVIVSIILWRNLFTISITFSPLLDTISNVIGFIIMIVLLYGLFKKNHIGYYASEIMCIYSILMDGSGIFFESSRTIFLMIYNLIFVIFYIYIGYILYKNKKYFGLND